MVVLKKLDLFWRQGDSSVKQKVQVFKAVVKSKLLYGLESMQLTQSSMRKLYVFHLKGLRKILKMETTFVNRENSNDAVYDRANNAISDDSGFITQPIRKLSTEYERAKLVAFAKLILAPSNDPKATVTFEAGLVPHNYGKKRIGRPRLNWVKETTALFWDKVVKTQNPSLGLGCFDISNAEHNALIYRGATELLQFRWHVHIDL